MICPNCQHENPAGARFCNECGTKLEVICAACGTGNPPGAKFCNQCGSRLGSAPVEPTPQPASSSTYTQSSTDEALAGQRRRVAIIFADVSGSTALAEKYDAEVVFEVMNECFAGLSAVVERHEGHVLKYIGDCMMALFGAPIAHGDDPQRAVLAGMEMQVWLAEFSQKLLAERGLPFRMRVGINYGTVIAGGVGSGLKMEYDVLGDAVNVAQRLEAAAEPGTVYVSEAVERLARSAVEFEPVGLVQVKGRAQGVQVFRAVAERAPGEVPVISERPEALVGRAEEMAELVEVVERAGGGEAVLLALSGEPGIGKTALSEQATLLAANAGFLTFKLSGAERQVHDPFAVPRHWLREVLGANANFVQSVEAVRALGEEVAPFAVELALLLHPDAPEAPRGLDPETRSRLQVQGLVALSRALSARQPLLLVIDDLQWLDPASQEAVESLAECVVAGEVNHLLLLLAFRAGTPPEWLKEERFAARVRPVKALSAAACLELMRQWVRPEDLPEAAVAEILERCGGHPHYLVELMRHLVETEQVVLESGRWQFRPKVQGELLPDSLYGAVAARLDRLQSTERSAVQSSSVVGQQFPVWLVRELEPAIRWEVTLPDLEAQQFLDQQMAPPEAEYRFKQAVVREVAYDSLLMARRKQLHTRVAEQLEVRGVAAESAATVAWHLERAELWPRAARWHREAGYWAAEAYANADALEHYESCLRLLTEHDENPGDPLRFQAHRGAGDVAARLGDYERAVQEYESCLSERESASAPDVAAVYSQLARCRHEQGNTAQADAEWRLAFRELSGAQDPEARRVRAVVLSEWGFAAYRSGRYRRALRLAGWSYREAQAAGAVLEQGDATNLRALAHQERGEVEQAIRWYGVTLEIARQTGDAAALATVQNNLGTLYFAQGRLREAEVNYSLAQAHWVRVGDRTQSATCLLNIGNVALARGEYEGAYAVLQESARIFEALGQPYGVAAARAVQGEVCLEMGRLEEAKSVFAEVLLQARELEAPDLEAYVALGLAESELAAGQVDLSEAARLEALRLIEEHDLVSMRGQELRLRGKLAQDVEALEAALRHFEEMESQQEIGRTLVILAQVSGQTEHLGRAAEIFRGMGAEGDLQKALAVEVRP